MMPCWLAESISPYGIRNTMPSLRTRKVPADRNLSNWTTRKTRQKRSYVAAHDWMRAKVLRKEPTCREHRKSGWVAVSVVADQIVPKVKRETDARKNYQGLCQPCHTIETTPQSARARRRGSPSI